jgi:outer membrane protein
VKEISVKIPLLIIPIVMTFAASAAEPEGPPVAPTKVAVIQFQEAIVATQEGQQVVAAMKAKFDPKKQVLDKRQAELTAMQQKLQAGGATMTEAARAKMQADITSGGRTLNHDIDDLNAEAQEDEGKAMQSMAGKIGNIIKDYATKNGFAVVLDVTGQSTPVLWAAQSANITAEIVKLYDTAHPVKAAAPAPAAPAKK